MTIPRCPTVAVTTTKETPESDMMTLTNLKASIGMYRTTCERVDRPWCRLVSAPPPFPHGVQFKYQEELLAAYMSMSWATPLRVAAVICASLGLRCWVQAPMGQYASMTIRNQINPTASMRKQQKLCFMRASRYYILAQVRHVLHLYSRRRYKSDVWAGIS